MADNYYPMGGVPDFYGSLLNSAQQQLVRMPDGSYRVAPTYSPPTTLSQIYGGMYSQPGSSGSASLRADPVGDLRASGGFNQLDDMVSASAPLQGHASQMRVASTGIPSVPGPRGSVALNKDQSRLDPGTALAFAGDNSAPPGVAAIESVSPLAPFIPPLPRVRPQLPSDMQFTPVVPGVYGGGDPWAGKRIGGVGPSIPGMVMGQPRGIPGVPRQPTYVAPQVPSAPPGVSFLQAQGQNTSGLTDGQIQNALMAAITGRQRGSFGAGNV